MMQPDMNNMNTDSIVTTTTKNDVSADTCGVDKNVDTITRGTADNTNMNSDSNGNMNSGSNGNMNSDSGSNGNMNSGSNSNSVSLSSSRSSLDNSNDSSRTDVNAGSGNGSNTSVDEEGYGDAGDAKFKSVTISHNHTTNTSNDTGTSTTNSSTDTGNVIDDGDEYYDNDGDICSSTIQNITRTINDSASGKNGNKLIIKVPRPRNAFILFRQHEHKFFINELNEQGKPIPHNSEISKIMGLKWKVLPQELKNQWEEKALKEKNEHLLKYPDYRYKPLRKKNKGKIIVPLISPHDEEILQGKHNGENQKQFKIVKNNNDNMNISGTTSTSSGGGSNGNSSLESNGHHGDHVHNHIDHHHHHHHHSNNNNTDKSHHSHGESGAHNGYDQQNHLEQSVKVGKPGKLEKVSKKRGRKSKAFLEQQRLALLKEQETEQKNQINQLNKQVTQQGIDANTYNALKCTTLSEQQVQDKHNTQHETQHPQPHPNQHPNQYSNQHPHFQQNYHQAYLQHTHGYPPVSAVPHTEYAQYQNYPVPPPPPPPQPQQVPTQAHLSAQQQQQNQQLQQCPQYAQPYTYQQNQHYQQYPGQQAGYVQASSEQIVAHAYGNPGVPPPYQYQPYGSQGVPVSVPVILNDSVHTGSAQEKGMPAVIPMYTANLPQMTNNFGYGTYYYPQPAPVPTHASSPHPAAPVMQQQTMSVPPIPASAHIMQGAPGHPIYDYGRYPPQHNVPSIIPSGPGTVANMAPSVSTGSVGPTTTNVSVSPGLNTSTLERPPNTDGVSPSVNNKCQLVLPPLYSQNSWSPQQPGVQPHFQNLSHGGPLNNNISNAGSINTNASNDTSVGPQHQTPDVVNMEKRYHTSVPIGDMASAPQYQQQQQQQQQQQPYIYNQVPTMQSYAISTTNPTQQQ